MISLLQFIGVFCGNGIYILENLIAKCLNILVEKSAIEREIIPAQFSFKIPLASLFSAVESGI